MRISPRTNSHRDSGLERDWEHSPSNARVSKGMAADSSGIVTIAGFAWAGFAPPTPGAHDPVNTRDIGITRLNPTGTKVLYSYAFTG